VGLLGGLGVGFFAISGLVFTSIKRAFFYQQESLADFFFAISLIISLLILLCLPFIRVLTDVQKKSPDATTTTKPTTADIHGWAYVKHPRFWYLFFNLLFLTGNGMMFIMKVGTVIMALAHGDTATQNSVATMCTFVVAAGNFLGRILAGVMTDFSLRKFELSRAYFMGFAGLIMAVGFAITSVTESFKVIMATTFLITFCHGLSFAITSALISDWFTRSQYALKW
jgi:MFS family permease